MKGPAFSDAHARSISRRMENAVARPRSLAEYVAWLVTEWQAEIPDKLHDVDTEPDSALGSPKVYPSFRAYLMGPPLKTDHDDRLDATYAGQARVRPIHAALRILIGRDDNPERDAPFMAHFLFRLACSGGDWQTACEAIGLPPQTWRAWTESAVRRLWNIWTRDAIETAREIA